MFFEDNWLRNLDWLFNIFVLFEDILMFFEVFVLFDLMLLERLGNSELVKFELKFGVKE